MTKIEHFQRKIETQQIVDFDQFALQLFSFQYENNPLYRHYIDLLGSDISSITQLSHIPFIPVDLFKNHAIKTGTWKEEVIYTSSGTTTSQPSQHYLPDKQFYLDHSRRLFEANYGPISEYHIFALLPGYLERSGSSLIDMAGYFIEESKSARSGFFLYDHHALLEQLHACEADRKVLLLGVSFALLDLVENADIPEIPALFVMETGGMKGRRKEMIRDELHKVLAEAFHVGTIHSEYGMTEALSQAYSKGNGIFDMPATMKVLLRDPYDPMDVSEGRTEGAINLIDLANIASCSFIQTSDIGKKVGEQQFKILGRMDNSDIRGCNLMVQTTL